MMHVLYFRHADGRHVLRKRTSRIHRGVLALLLGAAGLAEADEPPRETGETRVQLPAVVVTATRDARPLRDIPQAGGLLEAETLALEMAVRTLPDALKHEPGVMLQRTSHGQGSPYIRGFTGYRNVMLIDGIRLNNAVFREGPNQYWNTVDALALNRMEIVRGPGSLLYGSDAVGGVVQAFTRGEADLRPGSDWDRRLYYRYGTAENAQITRMESIGRLTDRLTLTLGHTFKDFGDLEGGRRVGRQPRTGYEERHWDMKLEYWMKDTALLTAAHQRGEVLDAWRTHSTVHAIDWEGLTRGTDLRRSMDQQRDLSYLHYRETDIGGFVASAHAGLFRHAQSETEDRLRTGDRWTRKGFDVETVGAFLTLTSPSPLGRLTYGLELSRDRTDSFSHTLDPSGAVRSRAIQGPVADGATYDMFGLFLQSETPLTEQTELLLGGRYAWARADAPRVANPNAAEPLSVSASWDALAGSIRLLQALDRQRAMRVFAGVSQGFRTPNLSNLTYYDAVRTGEIETPVQDLDPEYYLSCEAGIKAETGGLSAQLVYAYTFIDGLMVRTPTGRMMDDAHEITKRNAGDGYVQSVELDARFRLGSMLSVFGVFSWVDGKVEGYPTATSGPERDALSRLMPPTGRLGVRFEQYGKYWAEAACTVASRADRLSRGDQADTSRIPPGGTPGYAVVDLRAGTRVSAGLALSVAVENITDADYRIHGSGVNEPGRNLVLAMDWVF